MIQILVSMMESFWKKGEEYISGDVSSDNENNDLREGRNKNEGPDDEPNDNTNDRQ